MVTLSDIQAARERIKSRVRQTPLIQAEPLKSPIGYDNLYLKLESLQVTGSFKARGATNKVLGLDDAALQRGLVTASGGNHGLAVAYAGWSSGVPVTVYLGHNTPKVKAELLESWGAKIVFEGAGWDEANRAAMAVAEQDGLTYIHPFADPDVIAGQGTLALEILEQAPQTEVLLVAIGGGGLISGISLAAKAINPNLRIIGIEPEGAPTLYQSLQTGRVVELPEVNTAANTLAPRSTAQINFDIIRRNVDEILLVSDDEMTTAARWLWFEFGIGAELSGAASIAALMSNRLLFDPGLNVCALICGSGTAGI